MLAQNFKTPAELNISNDQFDALVKTLGILERNEVAWADTESDYSDNPKIVFTGHFNMGVWQEAHVCGTVCCIGGTAELVGNVEFDEYGTGLGRLFYPYEAGISFESITVEQAARALRNYLTHGEPKWKEVLNG